MVELLYIYKKDNKEQSHMVTYNDTNNIKLEQPHKTFHCRLSALIWHDLVFH